MSRKAAAPTHAGGVVVRRDGQQPLYLIVTAKKRPREWVLPKGHIKVGEDPRCTAVREVAEESGVLARVEARAGTALVGHRKKRVIFFVMAYCGRTPRRSSERRRVAWRDYTRARRELSFEEARAMLSVAHRYLLDNTARIESG